METVVCKKCGEKNGADEIFCKNCGTTIMTSEYIEETKENEKKEQPPKVEKKDVKPKKTKDENSKKKLIIIISAVVALLVIVGVCLLIFMPEKIETPTKKQIISALNKDTTITEVKINKETLSFKVKKLEILSDSLSKEKDKYTVVANVVRENDMYRLSPAEYTINFVKNDKIYEYKSAQMNGEYEISLIPLVGYPRALAEKEIGKQYKGIKFQKQVSDLEKGIDKIYFNINNDEMTGTIVAIYKFDEKTGWKFKKINNDKLNYRPGITHKKNGLYTNTAVKNIMFFGIDADGYGGRSDCMMLVSIDTNTSKIKLTSFMRDTYVQIPGSGGNKLNAAYALGGPELAVSAISNTYGIKIDNYASTNFTTFKNIINSLGGVSVNVTADEAGYINWQLRNNGQTGVGLVSSGGGNVRLNGQQALWLCRDRGGNGFSGSDFTRTGRQRKVIKSLISTYKSYGPSQVLSTLNNLKGNVVTDLSANDLKWLANNSPKLFDFTIEERCVPDTGEWTAGTSPGGMWIISINDWSYLTSDIQKYIYEDLK